MSTPVGEQAQLRVASRQASTGTEPARLPFASQVFLPVSFQQM